MEIKIGNIILYIDRVKVDPYDDERILLYHLGKEVGRAYIFSLSKNDKQALKCLWEL